MRLMQRNKRTFFIKNERLQITRITKGIHEETISYIISKDFEAITFLKMLKKRSLDIGSR